MKQVTLNLDLNTKKTRERECLDQIEQAVPWSALLELIDPFYPEERTGRPSFSLSTMLRVYFMQQWFKLSDPAMEEAFFDAPLYKEFAQLEGISRVPIESTILRFRHQLEKHKLIEQILATVNELLTQGCLLLKTGIVVDATLVAAPTSTKNKDKSRDPEMHTGKKGNQWYFGKKAPIGVEAESGLLYTVRGTSGHVSDIAEASTLLLGEKKLAFGSAGYQGLKTRADAKDNATWHIAMRPGERRTKPTKPMPCCWTRQKNPRTVCGPRWNTRFGSSNASSDSSKFTTLA